MVSGSDARNSDNAWSSRYPPRRVSSTRHAGLHYHSTTRACALCTACALGRSCLPADGRKTRNCYHPPHRRRVLARGCNPTSARATFPARQLWPSTLHRAQRRPQRPVPSPYITHCSPRADRRRPRVPWDPGKRPPGIGNRRPPIKLPLPPRAAYACQCPKDCRYASHVAQGAEPNRLIRDVSPHPRLAPTFQRCSCQSHGHARPKPCRLPPAVPSGTAPRRCASQPSERRPVVHRSSP